MAKLTKCPNCKSKNIEYVEMQLATGSTTDNFAAPDAESCDADITLGFHCKSCMMNFATRAIKETSAKELRDLADELEDYETLPNSTTMPWGDDDEEGE